MKKKNETSQRTYNARSTRQATALSDKIKAVILDGDSFRKRVAADLAMPVISVANDGVFYDPAWQDDGACHGL